MKRFLYNELVEWRAMENRKPLLLYGARQTGKTHLLCEFGRREFSQLHYLNFEQDPAAAELFEGAITPDVLLPLIELYLNTEIHTGSDLLFLDEIQECPRALTSLKYFCEYSTETAICSAGSFMGLAGGTESYPVGKIHALTLYPMSFPEFLLAYNKKLHTFYASFIASPAPLPDYVHGQLWRALRLYYVTGGMPEVVRSLLENGSNTLDAQSAQTIETLHDSLLTGYRSDFAKHSGIINAHHIHRIFEQVPHQLSREIDGNVSRFTFKDVLPKSRRYRDVAGPVDWLKATGLVYSSYIVDSAEPPLGHHSRESIFKLYLFDIGLLHRMLDIPASQILGTSYGTYKGYIAENFVATQLVTAGTRQLYTWRGKTSEIEFLIQPNGGEVPIEVKSGTHTKRAKSLHVYREKYKPAYAVKMSARNYSLNGPLIHIPLYAAADLYTLLDTLSKKAGDKMYLQGY